MGIWGWVGRNFYQGTKRNKAKGSWETQHRNQKEVAVAGDSVVQGEPGQELQAKGWVRSHWGHILNG